MDEWAARRDALRQAATAPGADLGSLLDAALTELDGAIEAAVAAAGDQHAEGVPETLRAERRLLQAAFQQVPVALLVLTADGTIRRANIEAAALFGTPAGYATGRQLTAFVDPPQRAVVQTQLAAVARTGASRQIACRMLAPDGPADVTLAVNGIDLPGEQPLLAVTVTSGRPRGSSPGEPVLGTPMPGEAAPGEAVSDSGPGPAPSSLTGSDRGLTMFARRLDMVTAVTRLLLDNSTVSEAAVIQRCARLLSGDLADWVLVDVVRDGGLHRQVAVGPHGPEADKVLSAARGVDPEPSTLPWQVHESGKSALLAHVDDLSALGAGADGTPLLMSLRATSLLVVPVSDGSVRYGTLSLTRSASAGRFTVADLALAEDLSGHLAVAMRTCQTFRLDSEVAEGLRASLSQVRLPEVPGLELAAASIGATGWHDLSGDFYDVFRVPSGWAIAIGDVSGTGLEAAVMTAAVRHAIRALAHGRPDPAGVLAAASEVLLSGDYGERYATAMLAFPETTGGGCRVRLAIAGHPGPAVVRADGRVEIGSAYGLPLGLLPDAVPGTLDVSLDRGDLLLFYTNGVTQACTPEWEFFEDEFADVLAATVGRSAAETVRAVTDKVTDFCGGEFRDDVTVLAMRVR